MDNKWLSEKAYDDRNDMKNFYNKKKVLTTVQ